MDENNINKSFNLNPDFVKKHKSERTLQYYIDGVLTADRFILSEAITLIESDDESKEKLASDLMKFIYQNQKDENATFRIAITGAPGVGKSTFIETFGKYLADKENKIAVLAIDPSSQVNKGSILGDKTRMQMLSSHRNAFIRPTSSGSTLGGVARGTKDTILLCEAAGFNTIFIETVGVGQSEYWASMMSDVTLLLLQPGAGDDLQGIKKGIMEMADIFVVNKTDGDQKLLAEKTSKTFQSILPLFHSKLKTMDLEILSISAINSFGFDYLFSKINSFKEKSKEENFFLKNRLNQEKFWFDNLLKEIIYKSVLRNKFVEPTINSYMSAIEKGDISASKAFQEIQQIIVNLKNG
jgi:LAO/AO transport system kinase